MSSLDEHRWEVVERLARLDDELAALRTARATDPADDEHDPEGSTLSSDWSRLTGLRADAVVQLELADAALASEADGTYGVCVTCGRQIPPERLAVRPAARQCVACANRG